MCGVWRPRLRAAALCKTMLSVAPAVAQPTAQFESEITTSYPFDSSSTATPSESASFGPRSNSLGPNPTFGPVPRLSNPGSPSPKAIRAAPATAVAPDGPMVRVPWAEFPMTLMAAQRDLSWRATLPSSGIATWGVNPVQNPERALADVLINDGVVGVGVVLEGGAVLTSLTAIGRGLALQIRFADGSVEPAHVRRTHRAYDLALLEPGGQRVRTGLPLARHVSGTLGLLRRGGAVESHPQGVLAPPTSSVARTRATVRPVPVTWFAATWGSDGVAIHPALRPPQLTELGSPLVNASGHLAALVTLGCVTDESGPTLESRGCRVTRVALTSGTLGDFLGMGEDVAQVWFGVIGETTDTGWARGVLVTGLTAGSPAAAAGLRPAGGRTAGDVIVAIDDTPVYEMEHLRSVLKAQRPGSKPVLTILREGRLQQLTVALPSRERLLPVAETPDPWVSF